MWQVAVFVCLGWIVSLCLHEFGHAVVAYWGGDTSVKEKGYLTLNPLKYTDPGLSLVLPIFFLLIGGIALPGGAVYIDRSRLRDRGWESAVSAAGPLANFLVVLLLAIPFQFSGNDLMRGWLGYSLAFLVLLQIFVILINLLPIPPLDGYGIIEPWLPKSVQGKLHQFGKYGIWVLIGLLWFVEPFNRFLWNLTFTASQGLGVPLSAALAGDEMFRQYSPFLVVGLIVVLWLCRDRAKEALRKGRQLITQQKYKAAIAALDRALEKQPNLAEAWTLRGYAFLLLSDLQAAIASYDRAVDVQPNNAAPWHDRGVALSHLQRYEEAIASYDRAIALESDSALSWQNRGHSLKALERDSEALESYDNALKYAPKDVQLWLHRGLALMGLNRDREAIEACDRALELQPDCGEAWYNKACCYGRQNEVTLAGEALKHALYYNFKHFSSLARTDPDLDCLRNDPRFQELLQDAENAQ